MRKIFEIDHDTLLDIELNKVNKDESIPMMIREIKESWEMISASDDIYDDLSSEHETMKRDIKEELAKYDKELDISVERICDEYKLPDKAYADIMEIMKYITEIRNNITDLIK